MMSTPYLSGFSLLSKILSVREFSIAHYDNNAMQYTCIAIFHSCKNDNFQMKNYYIFLFFAQDIGRGYMLELPASIRRF